tara:strand:- start:22150 stop:22395 length:246 start_codon:yes stop_codon:yes gene_type:complete
MKVYKCKECDSDQVSVKYSVEINVNEMEVDDEGGTFCRYASTDNYMNGDYSEHVVCNECGNTWEADDEWMYEEKETKEDNQ